MKLSLVVFAASLTAVSFAFKEGVDLGGNGDPKINAQSIDEGKSWGAQTSNRNSVNANTGDGNWKGGANSDGSQSGQDTNGNSAKKTGENSFVASGNDGTSANADIQGKNGVNTKFSDGNGFNMLGNGNNNEGQGQAVNANDQSQIYKGWKQGATGFGSDPKGNVYKVDGIQQGASQVVVSGNGKQYTATKNDRETSFVEKPANLWGFAQAQNYKSDVTDAGNQVQQSQVYSKNIPVYRGEIDGKTRTSRILDPITGKATLLETQVNQVQESTCHPDWVGQANPPQKFKILKDTVKITIPPKSQNGNDISYEWPSCVNAEVTIEVPPNINVRQLGAQLTVALPETGQATCGDEYKCGPLQCFQKNLCSQAVPADGGEQKSIPNYMFSQASSLDTCNSQSGVRIPIKAKVCPTDDKLSEQDPFVKDTAFFARNGDMVIQVRGYRIGNLKGCDLVNLGFSDIQLLDCRQAVISYTMNVGGIPKFNSFAQQKAQFTNDADKLAQGQVTGEHIGVGGSVFNKIGNLFGGGGGGSPAPAPGPAPAPATSNPFGNLWNQFSGGKGGGFNWGRR